MPTSGWGIAFMGSEFWGAGLAPGSLVGRKWNGRRGRGGGRGVEGRRGRGGGLRNLRQAHLLGKGDSMLLGM